MAINTAIQDFVLANPAYAGATVNFFTVDPVTGLPTAVLAPIFVDQLGLIAAANPQPLDNYGKFILPIYCGVPVIAQVNGGNAPSHSTGIIFPDGSFRGFWATATTYYPGDVVEDGPAGTNTLNLYVVVTMHLSGVWAADSANPAKLLQYLGGANAAATSAAAAAASAAAAAASAAVLPAPSVPTATEYLRANAAGNAFEFRTAQQHRQDIGTLFSNSNKPVATPYNMVAGDVGKVISSESMGGAGVVNLLAGATVGIGACVTLLKRTNQLTVNTNGADRVEALPGFSGNLASLVLIADEDNITLCWDGGIWKPVSASPGGWIALGAVITDAPTLRSTFSGFKVSTNGATEIDIAAGTTIDSARAVLMKLTQVAAKSTAAWALGLGAIAAAIGGLDTGAVAASTWYNAFLIRRPDTGAIDVAYSVNGVAVGPTLVTRIPAAFSQFAFLFSFLTDGSGNVVPMLNDGDDFYWTTILNDINAVALGAATNFAVRVPPGRRTRVYWQAAVSIGAAGGNTARIYDPSAADVTVGGVDATGNVGGVSNATTTAYRVAGSGISYSDTNQHLRAALQGAGGTTTFWLSAAGWNENTRRAA